MAWPLRFVLLLVASLVSLYSSSAGATTFTKLPYLSGDNVKTTDPVPNWMSVSNIHQCVMKDGLNIYVYQPRLQYYDEPNVADPLSYCVSEKEASKYRPVNLMTVEQAQRESCLDDAFDKFGRQYGTNALLLPRHQLVLAKHARVHGQQVSSYSAFTPRVYLKPGEPQVTSLPSGQAARTRFVCAVETVSGTIPGLHPNITVWKMYTRDGQLDRDRSCGSGLGHSRFRLPHRIPYIGQLTDYLYYPLRLPTWRDHDIVSAFLCGTFSDSFTLFPRSVEAGAIRFPALIQSLSIRHGGYIWMAPILPGYVDAILVDCLFKPTRDDKLSRKYRPTPIDPGSKWIRVPEVTKTPTIRANVEAPYDNCFITCNFQPRFLDGTLGRKEYAPQSKLGRRIFYHVQGGGWGGWR
eukprot:scpid76297/ scgid4221/ 